MPARHHIQLLKLNFLYDILQQEENSLMFRFFLSQKNNPVKGDWVSDVLKLVEDMNLTCDQIKNMKHSHFLKMVRSYVHSNAINYLKGKIKSKGKEIMYGYYLETQNYLLPNNLLTLKEQCDIFKYRTRTNYLHCNFPNNKNVQYCLCKSVELNNTHLYQCEILNN